MLRLLTAIALVGLGAVPSLHGAGPHRTRCRPRQCYTLTVSRTGSGRVTSVPGGIDCGTRCSAAFRKGRSVTLIAEAPSGQAFAGWGGACTGTKTCRLVLDRPTTVSATFGHVVPCASDVPAAGSSPPPAPSSELQIAGPNAAAPGQEVSLRLTRNGTQVAADRWEQALNLDRYTGTEYISSSCLRLLQLPDGTLEASAPAPGRYRLSAWLGSSRAETYLLVHPDQVVPQVRGLQLQASGPLDRAYAASVLARARSAGFNWVSFVEVGGIDLDVSNPEFQANCSFCVNSLPLGDLAWLMDEAHRQGLHFALSPSFAARSSTRLTDPGNWYVVQTPQGVYGDLPGVLPSGSPLVPAVMAAYSRFALELATLGQQHGAEAMFLGNESQSSNTPGSLLWSQTAQWTDLVAQLRRSFGGQIWIGQVLGGCQAASDLDIWRLGDGINATSSLHGSGADCAFGSPESATPTAERMFTQMESSVAQTFAGRISAATGLPLVYRETYMFPVDGVNYLGVQSFSRFDRLPRDNQEIVDYFEALMRVVSSTNTRGLFLFAAELSQRGYTNAVDPLKQPELLSAIANWWGGDVSALAPCWTPPPTTLLADDFEPSQCPTERQDAFTFDSGWRIVPDTQDPANHVLRGTAPAGPVRPIIGRDLWTDYSVRVRVRLVDRADEAGLVAVRVSPSNDQYVVQLGYDDLILFKCPPAGSCSALARAHPSGGIPPGRWFDLEAMVTGPTIVVRLDGVELLRVTDSDHPLLTGGIHLGVSSASGTGVVDFDELRVEQVG
jgi:hypothetical protein